jgi:hypothetical protein
MVSTIDASLYLFHHVFFPSKLPQGDDYDTNCELILIDSVIHSLKEFRTLVPKHHRQVVDPVIAMVARLRGIHGSHGDMSEGRLKEAFQKLDDEGISPAP